MYYPTSTAMPSRGGKKNLEHLLFAGGKCCSASVDADISMLGVSQGAE